MKQVAGYTAVVLGTLSVLILAWQFRQVIGLFVISLFIAAALRPFITWLVDHGLSLLLAQLLVYTTILFTLGATIYFISSPLLAEVEILSSILTLKYETIYALWREGSAWQQTLVSRLPSPTQLFELIAGPEGRVLLRTVLGLTQGIFAGISTWLVALLLSPYWSLDHNRFERLWLSLLPSEQRVYVRDSWRAIESAVGSYIRSEIIQSVLLAILLWPAYWVLGLDYPTILAVVAAITWAVPLIGAVFILGTVVLVAFTEGGLVMITAVVYTILVLLLLELVIEFRLFNRRSYSSVLILFTMIPLADSYGLSGLIIAPLFAIVIQILFNQLSRRQAYPPNMTLELENLEERYQKLRTTFDDQNNPPSPEVVSIIDRLSRLVQEAKQLSVSET